MDGPNVSVKPCNVLFVSPAFPVNTFWNLKAMCAVVDARHMQIPLGLITVAALLPAHWTCRLVDRNVSELTDNDLDGADVVMTGGMNVQRFDCLAVVERAQRHGKPVVVGGPDATSEPDLYAQADFVVTGEVEVIIGDFVAAWEAGERFGRFAAEKFKADITRTPVPRFDLLQRRDYLHYSVQFSRGCPFTCEFCDIIELYGRVPRVKTVGQFLGELEALHASGYRGHLDFVDDNFIGNKKAVKALLPPLIEWQKRHRYPFWFSTEASLNLAGDDDLLALMRAANFGVVFVGIESPDPETLVSTRKKQNVRGDIAASVHRIQAAGLIVIAGFIVGFDSERASIAGQMIVCIEAAAIPVCMAGLLVALPNTQLHRRLELEGRLFPSTWLTDKARTGGGDQCMLGLNFITRRPRREILTDYRRVIDAIYTPPAYFARVRDCVSRLGPWPPHGGTTVFSARWHFLGIGDNNWRALSRLVWGAARGGPRTLFSLLRTLAWAVRKDPDLLTAVGVLSAFYLHLGPFSRTVSRSALRQIEALDRPDLQHASPIRRRKVDRVQRQDTQRTGTPVESAPRSHSTSRTTRIRPTTPPSPRPP